MALSNLSKAIKDSEDKIKLQNFKYKKKLFLFVFEVFF